MTPHISAKKEDVAKTVLMVGDPLRAKWIAENFLENPKLINEIRGMFGYTGTYKGKNITVMGHGMGMPSIGIYSYELFKFYEVDTIIRLGTCGSFKEQFKISDVVVAKASWSNSTFAKNLGLKVRMGTLYPTEKINSIIKEVANTNQIPVQEALVLASDVFYGSILKPEEHKCDVVEMEAFALFANAKLLNKQAAVILTVSDSFVTKEAMLPQDRQTALKTMITVGLESAIKLLN